MFHCALLNLTAAPVVPWYWTVGGGIAFGLVTIAVTQFTKNKDADRTLDHARELYDEKMNAFCERVSIIISDYREETKKELQVLSGEIELLRNELSSKFSELKSDTKNMVCADDALRTLGSLYTGFIDSAKDDTLKNILHKGYERLNMFVDEIIRVGFNAISYRALKQKMMARGKMFKDDVDLITKRPEFTEDWDKLHMVYVKDLIKAIRPVFDDSHPNYAYNQRMILFLTEIQSFTHKSSVAMMMAWKEYARGK